MAQSTEVPQAPKQFVVASRAQNLPVSGIRRMFELADPRTINLGLGEPDFQPPDNVIAALKRAIDAGENKYGPTGGLRVLREAVAERLRPYADVSWEQVVITVGATEGLFATTQTIVDQGDEVLVPDPGFVLFGPHVKLAGGLPVLYPLLEGHGYRPRIKDLEELVTSRTRAVILNSPSNPTGSVLVRRDIEALVAFAEDHDLWIISDEVYDCMVYENGHESFLGRYPKLVYVNSFSKVYAMTGWRLGYLAAPKEVMATLAKISYYMVAAPPTPTQYAVLEGLEHSGDFVKGMVAQFRIRRDAIVEKLNRLPGFRCAKPRGAFYAFPSYDYPVKSTDLAMDILRGGVPCTPGSAFGPRGEGHLRFSYSNSLENIKKAMGLMRPLVEEYAGKVR